MSDADLARIMSVATAVDESVSGWIAGRTEQGRLFVTLANAGYEPGVRVLLRSLRAVSNVPILVLQIGSWPFEHEAPDVALLEVPSLTRHSVTFAEPVAHLGVTISKLWVFALTAPKRVAFLDSDCLVLRDIDAMFEGEDFTAVPDLLLNYDKPGFNSGVFAFTPSAELRQGLFRVLPALPVWDGDQSVLNAFFRTWRQLPIGFNFLRAYALIRAQAQDRNLRVLHFTTPNKPWSSNPPSVEEHALAPLDELWTARLTRDEHLALVREWRARQVSIQMTMAALAPPATAIPDPSTASFDRSLRHARRRLRLWLIALCVLSALQTALLVWLLARR